jgi:3-dehydroquinate dehydratase/shikimate dehydrogenase
VPDRRSVFCDESKIRENLMNKGKICVSVCAETIEEFKVNLECAAAVADFIELRFDCLKDSNGVSELLSFLKILRKNFSGELLATFRAAEQGGKNNLTFEQREEFWLNSNIFEAVDWIDLESDFPAEKVFARGSKKLEKIIKSQHFFDKSPDDLIKTYEQLKDGDVIKIAVQADDITDAIPVWKLLEKAKSEKKEIILIAMGEAGKWTRILSLAHGAFLTYAALGSGNETAPGQVSAQDLIETYRVKELDEQTEIYGVLGANTSYSLSPFMHNAAFKHYHLNCVFLPFQVKDLDEFIRRMVNEETREINLNFRGFSVTIPHKQAIIKHLDYVDEAAKEIGAVNTVKIVDGKLHGYNTDAKGFIEPLLNSYGDLNGAKVAVLGAGGAARACVYALKKENAEVEIFARDIEKAKSFADEFQSELHQLPINNSQLQNFDIVVNTTPLGTKGERENESIATAEQIENIKLAYDLVYNPFQTKFMSEADKVHVPKIGGMAMLVAQGAEQFKIWTGKDAPIKKMGTEVIKRL